MASKCQDWHAEDIKAEVRKRGLTISQLSRNHGLASSTLHNVFRHHWPKGERIIADVLGLEPQTIWPTRYHQSEQRSVA